MTGAPPVTNGVPRWVGWLAGFLHEHGVLALIAVFLIYIGATQVTSRLERIEVTVRQNQDILRSNNLLSSQLVRIARANCLNNATDSAQIARCNE